MFGQIYAFLFNIPKLSINLEFFFTLIAQYVSKSKSEHRNGYRESKAVDNNVMLKSVGTLLLALNSIVLLLNLTIWLKNLETNIFTRG